MVETARYEEVGLIGEVELGEYPELTLATVTGENSNREFGLFFSCFFGKNRSRRKIPMTAPVITTWEQ